MLRDKEFNESVNFALKCLKSYHADILEDVQDAIEFRKIFIDDDGKFGKTAREEIKILKLGIEELNINLDSIRFRIEKAIVDRASDENMRSAAFKLVESIQQQWLEKSGLIKL